MKRFIIIAFLLFIYITQLNAQSYDIRGSLREWVQVFSKNPNEMDLLETRLKLELLSTYGENTAFFVKSYYVYESTKRMGTWDFQEAHIDYYTDLVDIRFGQQVMAWGKADELNPTDILNPQNLTNLSEEKGIRKIGLISLKGEWKFDDFILETIWKPEFDHMILPPLDSRWAFFAIPGLETLPPPDFPSNRLQDTEWAFKLSNTISMFDFSISYFDGWDNIATPILSFNPQLQQLQLDKLKFYRTKMIGADFAGSIASVGIWGEAAYFITENHGSDPLVKNPYLQYVVGSDYTFSYDIVINIQYLQEINETEADEEIASKLGIGIPLQQAASFRVTKKFGDAEQHLIELFGIYDIKNEGIYIKPSITISPESAVGLEVGYQVYVGKEKSIFGRFEDNNLIYLKGVFSF